jgi:hypothetical protein
MILYEQNDVFRFALQCIKYYATDHTNVIIDFAW